MSDAQDTTPEVVEVEIDETPERTSRNSQAVYDAIRKESKERAAVTVAENAKKAKKAKDKALAAKRVNLGHNEALSGAAAIEKRITDRANAKIEAANKTS
jgi:hypothetical protein